MKRYAFFSIGLAFLWLCAADQHAMLFESIVHGSTQGRRSPQKEMKLFNNGVEEHVTFYAQKDVNSDETVARKGILIKKPHAKATVLICHGFMCDKYDVSFLHVLFNSYNSMTFDFRAHGEDTEGQVCTFGRDESYDVIAAAKFIKNHPELKDVPLIVYGFSMGAASAILAQAREKVFDAMVLDCPFDSTDKLIDRGIKQLKLNIFGYKMQMPGSSLLRTYAYNPQVQSFLRAALRTLTNFGSNEIPINFGPIYPEAAIEHVDVPCFFIACVNDDKAPEEAVIRVYDGAKGFKRCWIDPDGRKHFDTIFRKMHRYNYKVEKFISMVLDGSYKKKTQAKIKKDSRYCVISPAKKAPAVLYSPRK